MQQFIEQLLEQAFKEGRESAGVPQSTAEVMWLNSDVRKNLNSIFVQRALPLDPEMSGSKIRLAMGEMSGQELRTARAAIRWANNQFIKAENMATASEALVQGANEAAVEFHRCRSVMQDPRASFEEKARAYKRAEQVTWMYLPYYIQQAADYEKLVPRFEKAVSALQSIADEYGSEPEAMHYTNASDDAIAHNDMRVEIRREIEQTIEEIKQ